MIGNHSPADTWIVCDDHGYWASEALTSNVTPCPICMDACIASDVYKSYYGIRPRWMSTLEMVAWLRALPKETA